MIISPPVEKSGLETAGVAIGSGPDFGLLLFVPGSSLFPVHLWGFIEDFLKWHPLPWALLLKGSKVAKSSGATNSFYTSRN